MSVQGPNGNYSLHTISRGETLTKIANRYGTTVGALMQLNNMTNDRIIAGKKLVIPDNTAFVQKEDYSPNNMNLGAVTVDGQPIEQLNSQGIKTNFYANNLSALSEITLNNNLPASKIVAEMHAGKAMTRKDNDTAYSILNKVVFDHINNSSIVLKGDNGKFFTKSQWLEQTDLYNAFISEEVNGDNFGGEKDRLQPRGEAGNKVQLPSLHVDPNGTKYFTLRANNETLFFDETGKKVKYNFDDGTIIGATKLETLTATPDVASSGAVNPDYSGEKFSLEQPDVKNINFGNFYINGKPVDRPQSAKTNFYQNNINMFTSETLNDESSATRLDVQLNVGNTVDERDKNADDLLKKMLGTNYDKASVIAYENGVKKAVSIPLKNTDLYQAFISAGVNGSNFENGKLVRSDSGFNMVQFPSLEVDKNGVKYYTLHTNDGQVLYFNDKGEILPSPAATAPAA